MADRSVHRVIQRGDKGPDVKRLQQGLNKIVDAHEFDWRRIEPDGVAGDLTKRIGSLAAFSIGLSRAQIKKIRGGTFTQHAQQYLRGDKARTAQMKRAAKSREDTLRKLREEHRKSKQPRAGVVTFDGKACAAWIAPYLQKARDQFGWNGYLVSGFRTPEYSESLCYAMCGAPSCSGTCAGRASNHACPPTATCQQYEGAVDLSSYTEFGVIAAREGWPLKNDLPNDRVHYSNSGH